MLSNHSSATTGETPRSKVQLSTGLFKDVIGDVFGRHPDEVQGNAVVVTGVDSDEIDYELQDAVLPYLETAMPDPALTRNMIQVAGYLIRQEREEKLYPDPIQDPTRWQALTEELLNTPEISALVREYMNARIFSNGPGFEDVCHVVRLLLPILKNRSGEPTPEAGEPATELPVGTLRDRIRRVLGATRKRDHVVLQGPPQEALVEAIRKTAKRHGLVLSPYFCQVAYLCNQQYSFDTVYPEDWEAKILSLGKHPEIKAVLQAMEAQGERALPPEAMARMVRIIERAFPAKKDSPEFRNEVGH